MNTMLEIECKNECTDLGVSGVTRDEFLHEALVRGLAGVSAKRTNADTVLGL